MAIVKILFKTTEGDPLIMLFGDSYASWEDQYQEYLRYYPKIDPLKAWKSRSRWIGWGGLKWCYVGNFQQQLNREGCQMEDPDNPKPRQFSKMKFVEISLPIIKR